MQIVIDLPEEIIEDAKDSPNYYLTYHFEKIWRAIAAGTPLPKGHGRLVDENRIVPELVYRKHLLSDDVKCGEVTEIFDNAVVIDADMESNNAASN